MSILGDFALPLFSAWQQQQQASQANALNRSTQQYAMDFLDRQYGQGQGQYGQLQNQLLYGQQPQQGQAVGGGQGQAAPTVGPGVSAFPMNTLSDSEKKYWEGQRSRHPTKEAWEQALWSNKGHRVPGYEPGIQRAMQSGDPTLQGEAKYAMSQQPQQPAAGQAAGQQPTAQGPQLPGALQGQAGRYKQVMSDYDRQAAQTQAGYQQRLDTGMGMLRGMGQQAGKDIRRDYGNLAGAGEQDLVSRGMSGTTILPTMQQGVMRQQQGALGRLGENLRGQALGAYGQLSGDMMQDLGNIRGQRAQYQAGLSGDFLGAQERLGLGGLGRQDQYTGQRLNIMQGYPAQGPPPVNWGDVLQRSYGAKRGADQYAAAQGGSAMDWVGPAMQGVGAGVQIATAISDRRLKTDIEVVDPDDILRQLEKVDVSRWTYKADPDKRQHIGPMAQDFNAAFEVGPDTDPKRIDMIDAFGVALAAIKALSARVKELEETLGA